MNLYRKLLSLLFAVLLFLGLLPPVTLYADDEGRVFPAYIDVTVKADEKSGKYNMPVEGAVVTLKNGETILCEAFSDAEGKARLYIKDLDPALLKNATVQAYVTADRGKGISESARDELFQHFPKDENGEYYRYEYQLHSEEVDRDGNWRGRELPFSTSDDLDVVFVIDGTGSMYERMENVKKNLEAYIRGMQALPWDVRYSILEYRDYYTDELPILHETDGSHWYRDEDAVIKEIESIQADGGGDINETLGDALNYVVLSEEMDFRRNADRIAVIISDADNDMNVRGGGLIDNHRLGERLFEMGICAPVVIPAEPELQKMYQFIYEAPGGICLDIDDADFGQALLAFTESWISREAVEMELKLTEPRILYNLSVCYLANDTDSLSQSYQDGLKTTLDQYSRRLAQMTDGHVYLNRVILFSTDSILNFVDEENPASMADIQIQTKVFEEGSDSENVQIHANAHVGGFYQNDLVPSSTNLNWFSENLPDWQSYKGRNGFTRIQLSGTLGAEWDYSFTEDPGEYAETMVHESGHYLFGFRDEYVNQKKTYWSNADKPYALFGVMDDQYQDIEMSKRWIEYAYVPYGTEPAATTFHYFTYGESCEEALRDLLQDGKVQIKNDVNGLSGYLMFGASFLNSPYNAYYDMSGYNSYQADRTAEYACAGLSEENYIYLDQDLGQNAPAAASGALPMDTGIQPEKSEKSVPDFSGEPQESSKDLFMLSFPGDLMYSLYFRDRKDQAYSELSLLEGNDGDRRAALPVGEGGLAELMFVREADGEKTANSGYIERTAPVRSYAYCSPDFRAAALVEASQDTSFTFVTDDSVYTNGAYTSLNQALHIYSDAPEILNGEIYSVADKTGETDFSSISWFKYDGEDYQMLSTELSVEENQNPGAIAKIDGAGMYVLMGKKAAEGKAEAPDFLTYEPSTVLDGHIDLCFDDLNENSQYYYVFYSKNTEEELSGENAKGMVYSASLCEHSSDTGRRLRLNLRERGELFRIDVVIVLQDGSRSPASSILVMAPEADREGDGIPDWYLDRYGLWMEDDSLIAGSDPDGDGYTNLEEYFRKTNPIVYDAPVPGMAERQDRSREIIR